MNDIKNWVTNNLLCNGKIVSRRLTEQWFTKNNFIQEYKALQRIDEDIGFAVKKILGLVSTCKHCNKGTVIFPREFCSRECANQSEEKKISLAKAEKKKDYSKIREKKRQNSLKKYGVTHPTKLKATQDKKRFTNLEKYGCGAVAQNEEIKAKIVKTNLKRYGVKSTFQSELIKSKIAKTNLSRYGYENVLKSEAFKNRIKQTNLERYGFEVAAKSELIKERTKTTNLKRYGVSTPLKTNWQDKFEELNGVKHTSQLHYSDVLKEEIKNELKNVSGVHDSVFESVKSPATVYKLIRLYRPELASKNGNISSQHRDLIEILNEREIEFTCNDRSIISPKELDIYIPSLKLAFEINGTYWHSDERLPKTYHAEKSRLCEELGIRLIHLHEHKWSEEKEKIDQYLNDTLPFTINKNTLLASRDLGLKRILENVGFERVRISEPIKIHDGYHVVHDSGIETWKNKQYK